jgi:hypothetical protein
MAKTMIMIHPLGYDGYKRKQKFKSIKTTNERFKLKNVTLQQHFPKTFWLVTQN